MNESKNKGTQEFLDKLKITDSLGYQIIEELRGMLLARFPGLEEKIMYGGIIFHHSEDFCGLFAYAKHVSLEISDGVKLKDPGGMLEGKGKYRRHIKFRLPEDIKTKQTGFFLDQLKGMYS